MFEQGTSNAYAKVDVEADEAYVAEVIAQQFNGKQLDGVPLQVSAVPFGGDETPPRK